MRFAFLYFLKYKIRITFVNLILLNSDISECNLRSGVVKNLLEHYHIFVLLVMMVPESFSKRVCADFVLDSGFFARLVYYSIALGALHAVIKY